MNPLTWKATGRDARGETALCIGCGVVFAALFILFLLKSTA